MKTSNKLVLIALLLTLVSLSYYNYLVKKAFISGKYKDPYSSFKTLQYKDFDTLDIVSSTAANVKFVQGPFSVKIDSDFTDNIKLKQSGRHLQINAVFESGYMNSRYPYVLLISCPKLAQVNTNATYLSNNKLVTDTIVREDWNMRQVLIDGFTQDSLTVNQDFGSTVVMAHNHIRAVNFRSGKSAGSGSKTIILKDNQFDRAIFNITNRSKLVLGNARIDHLEYQLADSARLELSGSAHNLLNNLTPKQK